jgi:hypothetical protein
VNPLKFGNLRNGDSIVDVVRTITGSFLLRILKHDGFAQLKEITTRRFPESAPLWPDPTAASGPCGFCVKAFENRNLALLVVRARSWSGLRIRSSSSANMVSTKKFWPLSS